MTRNQSYFKRKHAETVVQKACKEVKGLHSHLHCIVPVVGINRQGKWKKARGDGKFLFPVKAMSLVFRGKF